MKKVLIALVIILILAGLGFAGWYFLIRKSTGGGTCTSDQKCVSGLKCVSKICSSGKAGSVCSAKADCTTNFCVNSKCTEGKVNDACKTYQDCQTGFRCLKSVCSNPPSYTKYLDKIQISKINPGSGPGPNNPETVTTEFKNTDAIEVDLIGVKSTTIGDFYYNFVDPTTGEIIRTSKNEIGIQQLEGQDRGTGTALSNLIPGKYEFDIYFNNELIYSTEITVTT
jgi:hypothetical protein